MVSPPTDSGSALETFGEIPAAGPSLRRRFADANERVRLCETALGHVFSDKTRLLQALAHSSSTQDKTRSNERLEFLGDAIIDFVVREHLFHSYPQRQEGDLTEAKSAVVCRSALAEAARRIDLPDFLILGRGIGKRRPIPESLIADAFEAVVAAIHLDGGIQSARNFILGCLGAAIPAAIEKASLDNHKSVLQKILQQNRRRLPEYRILSIAGPEHARTFRVAALIGGRELGQGSGPNKKTAEQAAARSALENLANESVSHPETLGGKP
ncbi:MAG: ribonuclease III [Planctomycetota bacterium]|nr:ribonuclease III [Planctomycetota bacterium]